MKMVVNLWNKIGDSEACGIGEGLKINSTLTELWLSGGVIFMYCKKGIGIGIKGKKC